MFLPTVEKAENNTVASGIKLTIQWSVNEIVAVYFILSSKFHSMNLGAKDSLYAMPIPYRAVSFRLKIT